MSPFNLFWSTRALTKSREDHLTEFLAAALKVSDSFRTACADLLFGTAEAGRPGTPAIEDVRTQVVFPGRACCPDMVLLLSDGRTVACEHKLDALETLGPESDPRPQLPRYLDLPVHGVLYVRSDWKPPSADVLAHPKYIRPNGREHFLWRDFYPLLRRSEHPVVDWLRDGFERLGFTPPHPSVGEMSGPDEESNRTNRRNFAKLWQRTRSAAHAIGWKVEAGSIVELYLTDNPSSTAAWVFISPTKADRFLLRATPHPGRLAAVEAALAGACGATGAQAETVSRQVRRKGGKAEVVDVVTSLRAILGSQPVTPEEMEARLLAFVEPLLLALQR